MAALFEAYITNLGKYNEGELVGETLKFPTTTEAVSYTHLDVYKRQVFYQFVQSRGLEQAAHGIYLSKDAWVDAMYPVSYTHLLSPGPTC